MSIRFMRSSLAIVAAASALSGAAAAQPRPPAPPAPPAAPPAPTTAAAQPPAAPEVEAKPDPIAAALAPKPGGLTPDEAAKLATGSSYAVRTKQTELRAAAAKVDQAFVAYFPTVTVTASYTRVSKTESVFFSTPEGPKELEQALDQYSVMASLAVPISDYVLRLSQSYASASHVEKARQLDVEAQALQSAADAKVAFYNWVRAKAQVVVAKEAVLQTQAHVNDARQTLDVGISKRADVLRLEAQVASAQQVVAEAEALTDVAEAQLRALLHTPEGTALEIGVDVMNEPATLPVEPLEALQAEAFKKRLEIRALDETEYSLKEVESVTKAGYLPRVDAFADLTVAKPNQRSFIAADEWVATWDAGVRLTWTINDTFTTIGAVAEAKARTAAIAEQKGTLRDALRVEVATAYADVKKSVATIDAAERGIVSAQESLRVRVELFRIGEATGAEVVDAETELTRARLRKIEGRIGVLVAKSRLHHATGRDVRPGPTALASRAEE